MQCDGHLPHRGLTMAPKYGPNNGFMPNCYPTCGAVIGCPFSDLWIKGVVILWRQTIIMACQVLSLQLCIKSPRSGVTLCFQFVSAALSMSTTAVAAAPMTFASHFKTVSATCQIFWVVCTIKWEPLIQSLKNFVVISSWLCLLTG